MWSEAPAELQLTPGIVHLWKVSLQSPSRPLAFYKDVVSKSEKERAKKFYFEKDKNQYIVGRANLRILTARYLALDPRTIKFELTDFGKPFLTNEPGLHFNISHSGGLAIMGFTLGSEIGVDLEKIKPDIEVRQIASRFFAPAEQQQLLGLPVHQQADGFFQCWTSKEAFIKAHGQGLSLPLDQFEVEVSPDRKAALKKVHWDPELVKHWDIFGFIPEVGFRGALVCGRKIGAVYTFRNLLG